MSKYVRKSRLEVLRGKLKRAGFTEPIRDDLPEDVAASLIAEMWLCPCCAAAGAARWQPPTEEERPDLKELLEQFDDASAPIH